jgi:hypothetical protein
MIAVVLTVGALVLCYRLARERFDGVPSAIATLGVAGGSGVAWAVSGSEDASGALRVLLGSVVAFAWMRAARGRPDRVRWIGAAAGVAAGGLAALPWMERQPFAQPLLGTVALADTLWSSRGGLLATSPAVYAAVVGLFFLWRVDRVLAGAAFALLAVTTLFVAAHAAWWAHAWPAPPAFLAIVPYFVCGAAALVEVISRGVARRPVLATGFVLAPLLLWNLTLMKAGHAADFALGEPASFGDVGAAQARILHNWVGHPPSAPASLGYALVNGVRPAAYDLLAAGRLLGGGVTTGEIDIGERDGSFVGDGWHGAERDAGRSFRWATRSATVVAPLDHAADLVVELVVRPYQPPTAPPQQLTLIVNDAAQPAVTLAAGWRAAAVTVPRVAWRSGVNHLELRFAYDAKPSDAGIADGRLLAASVDTIRVRVAP